VAKVFLPGAPKFGKLVQARVAKTRRKTNAAKRAEVGAATVEQAKDYLTLAQAGALLHTSAETVRYWVHVGKLRAFKPGRSVLVRRKDLDALVESTATVTVKSRRAAR
jgi:excisionase family DNA binding protein